MDENREARWRAIDGVGSGVWHYTNENGLKGILESGHLWATAREGLNDPSELTHALQEMRRQWDYYKNADGLDEKVGIDTVNVLIDRIVDEIESRTYFIASGTYEGDLLEHWKGYGSRGYAVCFDGRIGWDVVCPEGIECVEGPYYWRPVEYPRFVPGWSRELGSPSGKALDEVIRAAVSIDHEGLSIDEALERAYASTEEHIVFQKHHGYENECEVRMVVVDPPANSQRTRKIAYERRQVPYIELEPKSSGLETEELPILGVRIGPRNHQTQLAEDLRFVQRLLYEQGYSVPVLASPTPYLNPS